MYRTPLASTVVAWVGAYFFLVLLTISLASGLYYIAEIIEDHPRTSKKLLSIYIKATLAVHVIVVIFDRPSILCILTGIATHVVYYLILRRFPYVSLGSPEFISSCVGFVCSNFGWFQYYYFRTNFSIEFFLGFMIPMVWLVPFVYFVSLSTEETLLPYATSHHLSPAADEVLGRTPSGSSHASSSRVVPGAGKKIKSSFLWLYHFIRQKRDDVLPEFSLERGTSGRSAAKAL
ncbi:unnamed protein product [Closterium sp. Yama58-4]|nr:unnamed protein product [Closterium sp. Yama58-4]